MRGTREIPKTNPLSRSERLRNYQTKPNRSGERWSSGISMVLHRRSRGATGSHPSVTLVARRKSDQRAGHLFRFASTPLALRLSGFALSQERAREGTYNRSVLTKRSQIDQADAGVREYRWCSTAGREARPALIRPSRRSQDGRATSAPATFFDSLRLRWRSASAASRSRKKEREKGHTIGAF